jgi:hypothetical protein
MRMNTQDQMRRCKMKIETVVDVMKSFINEAMLEEVRDGKEMNAEFMEKVFIPLRTLYVSIKEWRD